jgi:3-hydroxyacyl-CoA dehydrogenase
MENGFADFTIRCESNPEIADTIVEIDNCAQVGFWLEIGVFEAWDAIGVPESVERMRAEGQLIPANVEKMLASGATSFYQKKTENVRSTTLLRASTVRCLIGRA